MTDYEVIRSRFLEWSKVPAPKPAGWPATVTEFAEREGINRKTLQRWQSEPEFKQAVAKEVLGFLTATDIAQIIDAMKDRAKQGNVQAADWLFKRSGITEGVNLPETETEDELGAMSDEDLEALAEGDA